MHSSFLRPTYGELKRKLDLVYHQIRENNRLWRNTNSAQMASSLIEELRDLNKEKRKLEDLINRTYPQRPRT